MRDQIDSDKLKMSMTVAIVAGAPLILQMLVSLVGGPTFVALGLMIIAATILQLTVAGFYMELVRTARRMRPNLEALIAIATTSLWIASLLTWYRDGAAAGAAYAGVNALAIPAALYGRYVAGGILSDVPKGVAEDDIVPRDARPKRYGTTGDKAPIRDIKLGDLVEVYAGERCPVDGVISEGMAEFIGGVVTGDPMPRHRGRGERVLAGERCFGGKVTVQAVRPGLDSLINDAASYGRLQSRYENTSRLMDRVLTPMFWTVLSVALVGGIIGAGFTNGLTGLINGLVIMGMGVPAGFALSSALPQYIGADMLRKKGVRLHHPDLAETARKLDHVYTSPVDMFLMRLPRFGHVVSDESEDEVLAFAWGLAKKSSHPMEPALRLACEGKGIEAKEMNKVFYNPGRGIQGEYDDRTILFGNPAQLSANGVSYRKYDERARSLEGLGTMVFWVAESYPRKTCLGILSFNTVLRNASEEAVDKLHDAGLSVDLLSPFSQMPHVQILSPIKFDTIVECATPLLAYNSVVQEQAGKKSVAVVAMSPMDLPAAQAADLTVMSSTGPSMLLSYAAMTIDHADPERMSFAIVTLRRAGQLIKRSLQISAVLVGASAFIGFFGLLSGTVASVLAIASLGLLGLNAYSLKARAQG